MHVGLLVLYVLNHSFPTLRSSVLAGGERRFPGGRAGSLDRGASPDPAERGGGGQRHLWDDPDAPGTHLPRPGRRDNANQPRFRRARPRLRRSWRDGGDDRGVRARLRARARQRAPRPPALQTRQPGDPADNDTRPDPRRGEAANWGKEKTAQVGKKGWGGGDLGG